MKKLLQISLLVLMTAGTVQAQQQRLTGGQKERIHAAKMAYVTDRLKLSPKQAAAFVPVYNNYDKELKDIRRTYFKKYRGANGPMADDSTARQFVEDNLDYQQEVIALKRRYNDSFLEVISSLQLAELYKAEREFKQMLMERLRECRSGKK